LNLYYKVSLFAWFDGIYLQNKKGIDGGEKPDTRKVVQVEMIQPSREQIEEFEITRTDLQRDIAPEKLQTHQNLFYSPRFFVCLFACLFICIVLFVCLLVCLFVCLFICLFVFMCCFVCLFACLVLYCIVLYCTVLFVCLFVF
jgi:hypothetical protein